MLKWDQPQMIEGVTVYGDHASINTFYVFPDSPRYRIDPKTGLPVFRFLKYRNPVDRAGGKKGGGFIIFDVEFVVDQDTLNKVTAKLQEQLDQRYKNIVPKPQVQIGQISYLRGASNLQVLDSGGGLVQKIQNPGAPSLYGHMITPFTVELSDLGAPLAEQALQGSGGIVQVIYDLWTPVRLPDMTVTAWLNASKSMSFYQQVDIDWNFWGDDSYRETIRQTFVSSEFGGVNIDPGTVTDQKVVNAVRDWGFQQLDDAVKRMVIGDIPDVSADDRKVPDGIEHVTRDIFVQKIVNFNRTFRQGQVMEWNPSPRGTLPNITSLKGADGKPIKWSDFAKTVDLDDPFFQTLEVNLRANADFAVLPLYSIDVHVDYTSGSTRRIQDFTFTGANDVQKFQSFIEAGKWKYKYNYEVNYKGETRTYKSPDIETEDKALTINVGQTGVLNINIQPGDINWEQTSAAQVTMQYEDKANGVDLLEEMFTLDKDHPLQKFQKVIFQPSANPYRYRVKYQMKDGKEYQVDWVQARSPHLFVNDPFSAQATVGIRAFGDFDRDIDNIFLDLKYTDDPNNYTQIKSVALNKGSTFFDWVFPVINQTGGKLTYSGTITKKGGTTPDTIAEKVNDPTFKTIIIGEAPDEPIEVQVLPDLLNYDKVKLVKVSLSYSDPASAISESKDIIFRKGDTKPLTWQFHPKDKSKNKFQWQATYFMADGTQKKSDPVTTNEPTVIPDTPA
jgi:hypothetical protein